MSLKLVAISYLSAGLLLYLATLATAIRLSTRGHLDSSLIDLGFERQGNHIRMYSQGRMLFRLAFYILVGPIFALSQIGHTTTHPNRG